MDPATAHARLAQSCLRYLLLEDIGIPSRNSPPSIDRYPFLRYAVSYWPHHVRYSGDTIHQYGELLRQFFAVSNIERLKACLQWQRGFRVWFSLRMDSSAELVVHTLVFHGLSNVLRATRFKK